MTTETRNGAPKQTALARHEGETGLSLVRPMVWPSRIFPGARIAVSVAEVQVLFKGRHGVPPVEEAQRFLLYCAGYGVDPRIGQAYLIPFKDGESNSVTWQKGVAYEVFMNFASSTGTIIGFEISPDPESWPAKYDPEFYAKIIVKRVPPLLDVTYGARLGRVAQKRNNVPARAWADGNVGWEHMFLVTLLRRGFRLATGLSRAYGAEEFGEEEPELPELPEGYQDAEIVPPAEEVLAKMQAAASEAEAAAGADTPTPEADASPAAPEDAGPWADEEGTAPEKSAEPDTPARLSDQDYRAQVVAHYQAVPDVDIHATFRTELKTAFEYKPKPALAWVNQTLGLEIPLEKSTELAGLNLEQMRTLLVELAVKQRPEA